MYRNGILKLVLFVVASFFTLFYLSSAIGQRGKDLGKPAKLKAELKLDKPEYLLREPVWVSIEVTNIGNEDGWFYFNSKTGLVIQDSKGKKYPCKVRVSQFPVTIKAGETLEDKINLLLDYGISDNKFKLFGYLPPEKYSVFYNVKKDVKSNSDTFTVMNPKGDELEAMSLLKESYDSLIEKNEKKWDKSLSKLNELVEKFPTSKYVPCALFQISSIYEIHFKNLDKTLNSYHMIINHHPNSGEAVKVLSYLVYYYKTKPDKPGLIKYLNDLIKKHPDTEVAKESQKELAKIKE